LPHKNLQIQIGVSTEVEALSFQVKVLGWCLHEDIALKKVVLTAL
jgi:hypothetical protein